MHKVAIDPTTRHLFLQARPVAIMLRQLLRACKHLQVCTAPFLHSFASLSPPRPPAYLRSCCHSPFPPFFLLR